MPHSFSIFIRFCLCFLQIVSNLIIFSSIYYPDLFLSKIQLFYRTLFHNIFLMHSLFLAKVPQNKQRHPFRSNESTFNGVSSSGTGASCMSPPLQTHTQACGGLMKSIVDWWFKQRNILYKNLTHLEDTIDILSIWKFHGSWSYPYVLGQICTYFLLPSVPFLFYLISTIIWLLCQAFQE